MALHTGHDTDSATQRCRNDLMKKFWQDTPKIRVHSSQKSWHCLMATSGRILGGCQFPLCLVCQKRWLLRDTDNESVSDCCWCCCWRWRPFCTIVVAEWWVVFAVQTFGKIKGPLYHGVIFACRVKNVFVLFFCAGIGELFARKTHPVRNWKN